MLAFAVAVGIGANDCANAMATSVGAKTLTLKQAVVVAAVAEMAGAVLIGSRVMDTIRKGIASPSCFGETFVFEYACAMALVATAAWLAMATRLGMPVSTTHSAVAAMIGAVSAVGGLGCVNWYEEIDTFPYVGGVAAIGVGWVVSPLISGAVGAAIWKASNAVRDEVALITIVAGAVAINAFFVAYKGTKTVNWELALMISAGLGAVAGVIARAARLDADKGYRRVQVLTAACDAFSHGANDVANAVGPFAAIYAGAVLNQKLEKKTSVGDDAYWILGIGGVGIGVGLLLFGSKMIGVLGEKLVEITPDRGVAIELGSALTVIAGAAIGVPISTTHCQVGATVGVGVVAKSRVDWKVVKVAAFGWIATVVVVALVSAGLVAQGVYAPKA